MLMSHTQLDQDRTQQEIHSDGQHLRAAGIVVLSCPATVTTKTGKSDSAEGGRCCGPC
jgi:hypothetical protein